MGRSHIYLRQLILAASIVATSACGSDQVSVPEQLRGEPACMWIMDTRMHFSDGTSKLIFDEPANQTGAACACLTETEFESKSRLEELNDMALQICEDLANGTPYEWTECQQNHDSGEWLDVVFWSAGNWEHPSGAALGCAGE